MERIHCLIIGSGPAGYTAAIYAARANLKPVMYTGLLQGGQLVNTTDVENYPGYPQGILGPEMMEDFKKQAERFGTDIRFGMATKVDFSSSPKKIWIDDDKMVEADAVILATGAEAKWLGIPSEARLKQAQVSGEDKSRQRAGTRRAFTAGRGRRGPGASAAACRRCRGRRAP